MENYINKRGVTSLDSKTLEDIHKKVENEVAPELAVKPKLNQ